MKVDLVDTVKGFNFEDATNVGIYLDENSEIIGEPYNAHDIGKDMIATQRLEAHYRIEGCDIYERRIVDYSLDGKDRVVRQDELCFTGNQQVAQRFLEKLLSEYK